MSNELSIKPGKEERLRTGLVVAATYGGQTHLFWVPRDATCYAVNEALSERFGEPPCSMNILDGAAVPSQVLLLTEGLTLREAA